VLGSLKKKKTVVAYWMNKAWEETEGKNWLKAIEKEEKQSKD
jgi:hypothetical protein